MSERILVIDGENQVLGRLASIVAKKLKLGYRVVVLNTEKIVVSGERRMVVDSYKLLFNITTHRNPYITGVRRPRTPPRLFKSAVEDMLPKNRLGKEAIRRLKAHIGVPDEYRGKEAVKFPEADASRLARKYVRLGDVAREMGWRGAEI
jgi:large subunit ribosomal protein L13